MKLRNCSSGSLDLLEMVARFIGLTFSRSSNPNRSTTIYVTDQNFTQTHSLTPFIGVRRRGRVVHKLVCYPRTLATQQCVHLPLWRATRLECAKSFVTARASPRQNRKREGACREKSLTPPRCSNPERGRNTRSSPARVVYDPITWSPSCQ